LYLWGVRLGALIAMDMAASCDVEGLILWQPVISGRTAINQFLRHRIAARRDQRLPNAAAPLLGDTSHVRAPGAAIRALRARLDARGRVDVGGFELDLTMVRSIEAREAIDLQLRARTVYWFSSAAMPRRLAARWAAQGIALHDRQLPLLPFWADAARPECPALLAATSAALAADTAVLPDSSGSASVQ
jgi:hypothetical protein